MLIDSTNTTDKKYFCKSENFVNGGLVLSHDDRFLILNCTQDNIKVYADICYLINLLQRCAIIA